MDEDKKCVHLEMTDENNNNNLLSIRDDNVLSASQSGDRNYISYLSISTNCIIFNSNNVI